MHLYPCERVEGSALCLEFFSSLATLASVRPLLCSLILRSLHGWVIYGTPLTVRFDEDSSSKAQHWFYHLPPKPFSPGFSRARGSSYFNPPGQCSSECWSKLEHRAGPSLGNLGYVGTCTLSLSGCSLRPRYVQLLPGF